ncbi:MAG: hypothetical protein K9N55_08540 [Phycisphaerae bacterium]|nr:hypothetical protein [Phycisphaerae bacterium]
MARKHIDTIISSGILICCVLLMASEVNAQSLSSVTKKQYQISGSVGVANVEMKGFPVPVMTNASGQYTVTVEYGWQGSITPTLAGYEFTPKTRPVSPVKVDLPNQDFSGEIQMFVISGTTGQANVTLRGFSSPVVSDPQGNYEIRVPYGTLVVITPELEGYSFTPPSLDLGQVNRNYTSQRFVAEKKRYTISGQVSSEGLPLAVVTMKVKGVLKEFKNGPDGRYKVEVAHGESVQITPVKEGYKFYPETSTYSNVTTDQITNYEGTQERYTITGNVGVDNAFIQYQGGSTLSSTTGDYSIEQAYGARLTIKPEKEGWRFSPPELSYPKLTSHLVNQNFQAEEILVTISGNTGTPGVLLDGLNDISGKPVISNAQGYFEAKVKYNSTHVVMPIKEGYTFTPGGKSYPNMTKDMRTESFAAEEKSFEIAGNVGLRDVVLTGVQGRFTSDPSGHYTVRVPWNWSGTITPELAGYRFDPPSKSYQNVKDNFYSSEDYTVEKKTYIISGLVTSPEGPIEGAVVRFGGLGGKSAVTNNQGRYRLELEHAESGKLQVEDPGYIFDTYSIDVPAVVQDLEFSFAGKVRRIKITGRLMFNGQPLSEVRMTADNGGTVTMSDTQGRWSLEVPYNWSGQIAMEKQGMDINDVLSFPTPLTEDQDLTKPEPAVPVEQPMTRVPPVRTTPGQTPVLERPVDTPPAIEPDLPGGVMPSDNAFNALDNVGTTEETTSSTTPPATTPGVDPLVAALRDELDQLKRNFAKQVAGQPDAEGKVIDRGPVVTPRTIVSEELSEVLNRIGDEVGISIICDMDVIQLTSVSIVDPVPLEVALDMFVAGTNFSWTKTDHYYLVTSMTTPENPSFIQGTITKKVKMANIPAANAVAMLSQSMAKFVKAEPEGTYVTVTAGPQLVERIVQDLRLFDVPKKQVLLQSKVVVMEEGDLLNMGIEWSWPQVSTGLFAGDARATGVNADFDTGGKGIWGVQMGYSLGNTFTNALTMGLNLLKENDKAQMIANPSTMASDGKLATMSVMTEEYYMLVPPTTTNQIFSQSEMQKIESGVSLKITPHIADNNDIVMDIAVELSDSIPSGRASGLPVVTRRLASNTVRVMDGGSAVIAGLNENRKTIKEKRTPGLSSIPLLGYLFSNTSNDTASRDVAIFVTANIIKPEGPAPRPMRSAAPPVNPMTQPPLGNQPPMGNMNNYRAGNMAPGSMPGTQYNAPPRTQYNTAPDTFNSTPNINQPGAYDSFQAELRRTIAEQRQNNPAYN